MTTIRDALATIAATLAAETPAAGCRDGFHACLDYREIIASLAPPGTVIPPAPVCPACGGPRRPDTGVTLVAVDLSHTWRETAFNATNPDPEAGP